MVWYGTMALFAAGRKPLEVLGLSHAQKLPNQITSEFRQTCLRISGHFRHRSNDGGRTLRQRSDCEPFYRL